jgi:chemotaxis protein CheC
MSGWNPQLTEDQIDSLKEVGNIGAGHAASELARLVGRKCVVSVPELIFADLLGIRKACQIPDAITVALRMRILGDIPASMLVITGRKHAERILGAMQAVDGLPPSPATAGEPDELAFQLALKQLGEALTHSFSNAISDFLGAKTHASVPEVVVENWSTSGDIAEQPGDDRNTQMAIHADFFDCAKSFQGKFVYVLGSDAQARILERLESLLG